MAGRRNTLGQKTAVAEPPGTVEAAPDKGVQFSTTGATPAVQSDTGTAPDAPVAAPDESPAQDLEGLSHTELRDHPEFKRAVGDEIRSQVDRRLSAERKDMQARADEQRFATMTPEQQKEYLYKDHQDRQVKDGMRGELIDEMAGQMQAALFANEAFPQEEFTAIANSGNAGTFGLGLFELGLRVGRGLGADDAPGPDVVSTEAGPSRRAGQQSPRAIAGTAASGALTPSNMPTPDQIRDATDAQYIEWKEQGLLSLVPPDLDGRGMFKGIGSR